MAHVIGIDEAGYGTNLGPLVIGGTLWQVPETDSDLYQLLEPLFCRPGEPHAPNRGAGQKRMAVGDSKKLYSSGGSLANLEQPLFGLLAEQGVELSGIHDLFRVLADLSPDELNSVPGYDWSSAEFPMAPDRKYKPADELAEWIQGSFTRSGVRCSRLAAKVVFPDRWNRGLDQCGNKASLLSTLSCQLVERLLHEATRQPAGQADSPEPVQIFCDKHGGRNHYAAFIQQEITPHPVRVRRESAEASDYTWTDDCGRNYTMSFAPRGEDQLPVALASMTAKYLREISMVAWNGFWMKHLPELKPTAGYPVDARRFRKDIAQTRQTLNIDDRTIWRTR